MSGLGELPLTDEQPVGQAGTKWVYDFAEGSGEMRDLLGG